MTLNPNNMSLTPVVMGPGAMNLGQVAVNPGPMGVHFVSNSNVASQAAASSRNIQKCSDENQTLPVTYISCSYRKNQKRVHLFVLRFYLFTIIKGAPC